jgi:hypothetical protein
MITASHILSTIDETYLGLVSGVPNRDPVPVFINPDRSEFRELPEPLRFIAHTPEKSVYVWDALGSFHHTVEGEYNLHIEEEIFGSTAIPTNSLWGLGINLKHRGEMRESDQLDYLVHRIKERDAYKAYKVLKTFHETDWSWAERYISGINNYIADSFLAFVKKWGPYLT